MENFQHFDTLYHVYIYFYVYKSYYFHVPHVIFTNHPEKYIMSVF